MYQTCTEFGFYQTSDSANQPFGKLFPLKYVVSKTKPEAFITKLLLLFFYFFIFYFIFYFFLYYILYFFITKLLIN